MTSVQKKIEYIYIYTYNIRIYVCTRISPRRENNVCAIAGVLLTFKEECADRPGEEYHSDLFIGKLLA